MNSPIDQLAKLQSACPSQLSCVASETNEQGETEYSHIVQADGVYLNCPTGVYPPLAQFAVWAVNNTPAIVAERDEWMAARNQWCQRAQRMGERAAKAERERDETIRQHQGHLKVWRIERDAFQQQLAERDAEIERLRTIAIKLAAFAARTQHAGEDVSDDIKEEASGLMRAWHQFTLESRKS